VTGDSSEDLSRADFDLLLREVLKRVHGALDEQARLRLLLDAVVSMAADLSLDGVLSRIVRIASELVGAQYAALGVLGHGPDRRLRTFIHHGMSAEQVVEIGDLPTGHGLLGMITEHPRPLRLHDIAAHPASYGFPASHPPMSSFLGVPVRIRDQVFGNLYLTEKVGGVDFTQVDEDVVIALAAAAGVAIENARLYEQAARRQRWLSATAEITALLAGTGTGQDALQAVAERAREVAGADVAWIATGTDDDEHDVRAVSGGEAVTDAVDGLVLDASLSRQVVRTGEPLRVPRYGGHGDDGRSGLGPAIIVPLRNPEGVEGVLALAWTPENADGFHNVDAVLPASFAEQAALALQVARAREAQQRLALFEDRDRIGRDLHDLVIQRLFAIGLSLQSVSRLVADPQVTKRLQVAVEDLDATIRDIRRSIFALGASDEAADIQTEVTRLVERAAATLKFRPSLRLDGPVRTRIDQQTAPHLLAVLGEALSNAARHARASAVEVTLTVADDVRLVVADNGSGVRGEVPESGLLNMRQRAEGLGGSCRVESSSAGTTVSWTVPL